MALHQHVENLIHSLRHREALKHLKPCRRHADLGCGRSKAFLRRLSRQVNEGWGLDVDVEPAKEGSLVFLRGDITQPLPFPDGFLDQISCLAVVEHLENPAPLLRECLRCLAPGGRLVFTTPSRLGLFVHEWGLRRVGLIRDVEHGEHQDFGRSLREWADWTRAAGFIVDAAYHFELGINVLVSAHKPELTTV